MNGVWQLQALAIKDFVRVSPPYCSRSQTSQVMNLRAVSFFIYMSNDDFNDKHGVWEILQRQVLLKVIHHTVVKASSSADDA